MFEKDGGIDDGLQSADIKAYLPVSTNFHRSMRRNYLPNV